jgi:phosphoribosylanthranilate isomerase
VADIKFCGLTRAADARYAAELGAAYLGVIFAGGPRHLSLERAVGVLAGVRGPRRVGVFARQAPDEIAATARAVGLDVIQLHADPTPDDVESVRHATALPIWAAVRVKGGELPGPLAELAAAADGLLLDARVEGALGGTGQTLDWGSLRLPRGRARIILAGGLTPANVRQALSALAADTVDVSSGIESAPGIKDHALMRAFADAVRSRVPA